MMDYIHESAVWNPYEDGKSLVEWIAITYHSLQNEEGNRKNDCSKTSLQWRSLSRATTPAVSYETSMKIDLMIQHLFGRYHLRS